MRSIFEDHKKILEEIILTNTNIFYYNRKIELISWTRNIELTQKLGKDMRS